MKTLEQVEMDHIIVVLKACEGNKLAACGILGISLPTLYARLKKYGIFKGK